MRNLTLSLVAVLACAVSVSLAQSYPVVDVYLDITDPSNVTITSMETDGTYGGQYFAIDALEIKGAVAELNLVGPLGFRYPDTTMRALTVVEAGNGSHTSFSTDPIWMEYGVSYNLGAIVTSSDLADFETPYFRLVDAGGQSTVSNGINVGWNGLGDGSGYLIGSIIPEPATLVMLALGGVSVIRRRR